MSPDGVSISVARRFPVGCVARAAPRGPALTIGTGRLTLRPASVWKRAKGVSSSDQEVADAPDSERVAVAIPVPAFPRRSRAVVVDDLAFLVEALLFWPAEAKVRLHQPSHA